jgi:hypothetical protein
MPSKEIMYKKHEKRNVAAVIVAVVCYHIMFFVFSFQVKDKYKVIYSVQKIIYPIKIVTPKIIITLTFPF